MAIDHDDVDVAKPRIVERNECSAHAIHAVVDVERDAHGGAVSYERATTSAVPARRSAALLLLSFRRMKLPTRLAAGVVALTGLTLLMLRHRFGLHADRTPPAWVTRALTFA